MVVCPECGNENDDNAFLCTDYGAVVSTGLGLLAASDDGLVTSTTQQRDVRPDDRRSLLLIALICIVAFALLCLVTALIMTSGGTVGLDITSPLDEASVTSDELHVSLAVTNPGKVARVEVHVDGALRGTLTRPPFITSVPAGEAGPHALRASAYDRRGRLVAEATVKYERAGQRAERHPGEPGRVARGRGRIRTGAPVTDLLYLATAALQ